MKTHELKCHPEPFQAITQGTKNFEVRDCTDRAFNEGDCLYLREWNPMNGQYTGRFVSKNVAYVSRGPAWGLPVNLVVMSLV
jgi:hypothetical protein